MQEAQANLRADLRGALEEIPRRIIAALQTVAAEPPALTPGRHEPGEATILLPFMRPSIVSYADPILDRISEAADYTYSPFAQDVRPAAGFGTPVIEESAEHRVIFHRSLLPTWVRTEHLVRVQAAGDSMEPNLQNGDLVALDYSFVEPIDGKLFVVRTDDGLVVKRLRGFAQDWKLVSDNAAYEPRQAHKDDRIIGRVAGAGAARDG